ncbi:hypothetical protein P5G65_24430 [Paenibacillus chondroitinus]|uniref:Uncharacterized protein n=1 Tax=Paenibacillus chondroitinus TaxID=59842 RepID=A0ABU6DH37_9BACL|nr:MULTISPECIES: hypothetical protein [Paenibacillus]MCY9663256.1 hypothetical protein [Paenibacillus anseongense]MEB4797053.1 hypothetical protein [Paenibacillus chondroitinus]
MKKSKWTKWQIGMVVGVLLFYLFQEVKESPQFLTAVSAAALSKDQTATVTAQKEAPNNRVAENTPVRRGRNHGRIAAGTGSTGSTGSSGSTGGAESSQPQLKAHTRSQAS